MERNYNIYKQELLAIMKSLAHWQLYLGWTKEPFTILTNHTNLHVTAGGGGTLEHFTWFRCTWLDSHKDHCYEPMWGCDIGRSNSLAWRSLAYVPLGSSWNRAKSTLT
jgi:hypothetical protein